MNMAAILINRPRTFVKKKKKKNPPLTEGSRRNLKKIGPVVSEEKLFKGVDGRRTDGRQTDGRWTTDEEWSQKLILSLRLRWAKKHNRMEDHQASCLHYLMKSI